MTKTPPFAALAFLAVMALSLLVGAACPRKKDDARPPPPPSEATAAEPPQKSPPPPPPPRPTFVKQPAGERLVVLYTASVQGYVTPCGCTADPLGGIARLSAAVDQARAAYGDRVVFVDAGDLLFEKLDDNLPADACHADARVDLLLDTYARKGLAATVLGPLDDVRGEGYRDERMKARGLLTVGVPDAGRKLGAGAPYAPGIVKDAGGVKVGITGFRVDDEARVKAAHSALEKEVARLYGEGAQAVIALAQAPRALVPRVVEGIAGLDVVIQGRDPGELPREPEKIGEGTYLVASAMQAQHLGVVELVLDGRAGTAPLLLDDSAAAAERRLHLLEERIAQYEQQVKDAEPGARRDFVNDRLQRAREERAALRDSDVESPPPQGPYVKPSALALVRGLSEEKQAKLALDAFQQQIPSLVAACEAGLECPPAPEGTPSYVGVETCFQCHRQEVQFWQQQMVEAPGKDAQGNAIVRKLSHATAWDTLVHDGKDKDRSCVGCHSIGWGEPGGYCKTSEVDFRQNVQCEACHGPASKHVELAGDPSALVRQEVDEAVCRKCHHVPHIPTTESFVFEDKLKHILGPGHGQSRLEEILRHGGGR